MLENAYPDDQSDTVQQIEDDFDLDVEIAGEQEGQLSDEDGEYEAQKKRNSSNSFYEDSPRGKKSLPGLDPSMLQDEIPQNAEADNAGFLTVSNLEPALRAAKYDYDSNMRDSVLNRSKDMDDFRLSLQQKILESTNKKKKTNDFFQGVPSTTEQSE